MSLFLILNVLRCHGTSETPPKSTEALGFSCLSSSHKMDYGQKILELQLKFNFCNSRDAPVDITKVSSDIVVCIE